MTAPVALHAEIAGPDDAPPLLMGGSLGTTLAMWDPQVAELSVRHRLVRFDHRGHGGSPVPDGPYTIAQLGQDVLALMDRLGLARAAYCGLSIGGMVGQWLAAHHPERVRELVLLTTTAHFEDQAPWLERAATVRAAGTTEVIADAVLARWFTPDWAASHAARIAELRAMICATPATGYAACCVAIGEMDLRPDLSRITAPTLVIGGAQDPSIPPAHQRAIAQALPGSRLEILEDAAHLPNIQHPGAVNKLIANHLGVSL